MMRPYDPGNKFFISLSDNFQASEGFETSSKGMLSSLLLSDPFLLTPDALEIIFEATLLP